VAGAQHLGAAGRPPVLLRDSGDLLGASPRQLERSFRRRLNTSLSSLNEEMPKDVPENVTPAGVEFNFTPYYDVPELEFSRDRQFCLLTLQHPSFVGRTLEQRMGYWDQKRTDRADRVQRVFGKCDKDNSKSLDAEQLKRALQAIGMPATEDWVHGLFQRHNKQGDGKMLSHEFENVVAEAWGRVPDPQFSDQFHRVHAQMTGDHCFNFIGRMSPVGWVLRLVRNLWPFALKRVAILRNTYENPKYQPELMETLIDTYEGQKVRGINNAMELAELASEQPAEAKGGLVVRIQPTMRGALHWPEGGASTLVPLRGFQENDPGLVGKMGGWFRAFRA